MIVKTDKNDFESYLVDAANIKGDCSKVFLPENKAELIELINQANLNSERITIAASRTGLNGGSVPNSGILISLEKLNRILSIDKISKTAVVEPGVILADFQHEVESIGLFYPPDPTETNCSLGGTVANNSSGARTFKYGPTRNYVNSIEVILPSGELLSIDRRKYFFDDRKIDVELGNENLIDIILPSYDMPNVKHAAGYYCKSDMDLIDLFIGSEGTLGIISKIELKLVDLPKNILSMIVFFEDESNLFDFVDEVRIRSRVDSDIIDLREIEFFDKFTLNMLREDYSNLPKNSKGAVWIEQEYESEIEDELLMQIDELIEKFSGDIDNIWYAIDKKERNMLKEFRHKIPLKVNDIISGKGLVKIGTDTAVPDNRFREYYQFVVDLIEKNGIDYVAYGHIGNSHLHFNMIPKDENELNIGRKLYKEICRCAVDFGGTISAEHGIGKLKRDYLLDMFGQNHIIEMARLKKQIDPNLILNIGNMFDEKFLQEV